MEELKEKIKSETKERFQPMNKVFYDKCKDFVIVAFRLLKGCLEKGESIPQDIIQDISIESDSEWIYRTRFVPALWFFVTLHRKELEQLPEFKKCTQYMSEEQMISKHVNRLVGHSHQKSLVDVDRILDTFLYDSFDETKPFEFNGESFDRTYAKIEDFFYCENVKFILSAPLQNFQCELEKIELAKNLRIVRMSKREREDLWRSSRYGGWLPDSLLPCLAYSLRLDFQKPKILEDSSQDNSKNAFDENPDQIARDVFDKVVSALRLFKPGVVGFSVIITTPITWLPIGLGSTTIHGHPLEHAKYVLTESEAKQFETFFAQLFGGNSVSHFPSFLTSAVNRFNFAYERKRPEDKVIDYMVAFETLYTKEAMGEPGYRIGMRAASLIGKTPDERNGIFKDIRKAYSLRNKILHGSIKIGEKDSLSLEEVSRIEQYLRSSIKEFTKFVGKEYDSIIDSLDEILLSQVDYTKKE